MSARSSSVEGVATKMVRVGCVLAIVACAVGVRAWPREPSEELHAKSAEHRKMHKKARGFLGEMSTMSIMKVYPKAILQEMHTFWCQEREEARVDRVESPVCDHWEDVRKGGWYSSKERRPPVDEVEEMHARGPRERRDAARPPHRARPRAGEMVPGRGSLDQGKEGLRRLRRASPAGDVPGALTPSSLGPR